MESCSDVVEVARVQTGDRDTAIRSHVDSVLLTKLVNHLFSQTGKGKHTYLVNQVLPRVLAPKIFEFRYEIMPHLHDSTRHQFKVFVPHLGQLFVS